jgi:hypothetical protein
VSSIFPSLGCAQSREDAKISNTAALNDQLHTKAAYPLPLETRKPGQTSREAFLPILDFVELVTGIAK